MISHQGRSFWQSPGWILKQKSADRASTHTESWEVENVSDRIHRCRFAQMIPRRRGLQQEFLIVELSGLLAGAPCGAGNWPGPTSCPHESFLQARWQCLLQDLASHKRSLTCNGRWRPSCEIDYSRHLNAKGLMIFLFPCRGRNEVFVPRPQQHSCCCGTSAHQRGRGLLWSPARC